MSETALVQRLRLALSEAGARMHRNNVGIAEYKNGSKVRYGVGHPGGSDLIGWLPVIITTDMVGHKFARFVAIEAKMPHSYPTLEQRRFIDAVVRDGGIAGVVRSVDEALALLSKESP